MEVDGSGEEDEGSQRPDDGDDGSPAANVAQASREAAPAYLPEGYEPSDTDVVCGRARTKFFHATGNKRYRKILEDHVEPYLAATTKGEKSEVVLNIMLGVQSGSPEGKFIRKDTYGTNSGKWCQLSHDFIRDKVSHAIRKTIQNKKGKVPKNASNTGLDSSARGGVDESAVSAMSSTSITLKRVKSDDEDDLKPASKQIARREKTPLAGHETSILQPNGSEQEDQIQGRNVQSMTQESSLPPGAPPTSISVIESSESGIGAFSGTSGLPNKSLVASSSLFPLQGLYPNTPYFTRSESNPTDSIAWPPDSLTPQEISQYSNNIRNSSQLRTYLLSNMTNSQGIMPSDQTNQSINQQRPVDPAMNLASARNIYMSDQSTQNSNMTAPRLSDQNLDIASMARLQNQNVDITMLLNQFRDQTDSALLRNVTMATNPSTSVASALNLDQTNIFRDDILRQSQNMGLVASINQHLSGAGNQFANRSAAHDPTGRANVNIAAALNIMEGRVVTGQNSYLAAGLNRAERTMDTNESTILAALQRNQLEQEVLLRQEMILRQQQLVQRTVGGNQLSLPLQLHLLEGMGSRTNLSTGQPSSLGLRAQLSQNLRNVDEPARLGNQEVPLTPVNAHNPWLQNILTARPLQQTASQEEEKAQGGSNEEDENDSGRNTSARGS